MLLLKISPTVQFLVNGDTLGAPSHEPPQGRPPIIPRTISYGPLWVRPPMNHPRCALQPSHAQSPMNHSGWMHPSTILGFHPTEGWCFRAESSIHPCRFSPHSTNCFMQGMEECYELGITKAIGLSNFNSVQLQRVLDNCRIKPANLQVPSSFFSLKIILHKLHPLVQTKMVGALLFRGIPDPPLNYLYRQSVFVTVVI